MVLNALAYRDAALGAKVEGTTLINRCRPSVAAFRELSSLVEQEDALIGSLAAAETMRLAAHLAHKMYKGLDS